MQELDIESLQRLAEAGLTGNTNTEVENISVTEVTKQQVLVQYLQVCLEVVTLIHFDNHFGHENERFRKYDD